MIGPSRFAETTAPDAGRTRPEDPSLRRAEMAMRRGKEAGKARVVFYRPEWGSARAGPGASHWLSRLRAALDEDRLEVYLQRILDLDGGESPPSFEALVRLREGGEILAPGRFLSDAERFGLVAEIDQWMIRAVLHPMEDRDDGRIAVNLSGRSVGAERMARQLSAEARRRANGLRAPKLPSGGSGHPWPGSRVGWPPLILEGRRATTAPSRAPAGRPSPSPPPHGRASRPPAAASARGPPRSADVHARARRWGLGR